MILEISRLLLKVHLGCTAGERLHPQNVAVSVSLTFPQGVQALESDRLSDTVCYQEICTQLKTVAAAKEYHTVEHLAFQMAGLLKPMLKNSASAELFVHKESPPIENLAGGVTVRLRVAG